MPIRILLNRLIGNILLEYGETLVEDMVLSTRSCLWLPLPSSQHLAFYNALFRYGTREELYTKGGFSTSRQDTNDVPPITNIYIGYYCCKIVLDNNGFEKMVGHGGDANLVLLDKFF